MPAEQRLHRERHRQVEDHDVVGVSAQSWIDGPFATAIGSSRSTRAARLERDVSDLPRIARVVADRVKFTRRRILVRMRGERAGQPAAEVAVGDRFELVRQHRGVRARLDQRQGLAGELDHVGVDRIAHPAARARCGGQPALPSSVRERM